MHDDLCQQLAGIEFLSQSLTSELTAKNLPDAAQAREIAESVQQAMAQTRELARGLAPVAAEPDGLMLGLRELVARTAKVFRVECKFRCPVPVLVHDQAQAIHLYRIAQEAVGNAIKHGRSRSIAVALQASANFVRLEISDDGTGVPRNSQKPKGMGLRIMRYRAGVIGGSLALKRNSGGGVTVVCSVNQPLLPAKGCAP